MLCTSFDLWLFFFSHPHNLILTACHAIWTRLSRTGYKKREEKNHTHSTFIREIKAELFPDVSMWIKQWVLASPQGNSMLAVLAKAMELQALARAKREEGGTSLSPAVHSHHTAAYPSSWWPPRLLLVCFAAGSKREAGISKRPGDVFCLSLAEEKRSPVGTAFLLSQ